MEDYGIKEALSNNANPELAWLDFSQAPAACLTVGTAPAAGKRSPGRPRKETHGKEQVVPARTDDSALIVRRESTPELETQPRADI